MPFSRNHRIQTISGIETGLADETAERIPEIKMHAQTFLALILAAVIVTFSQAQDSKLPQAETPIAGSAALKDVELLRRALEKIHPGYDRYTSREAIGQLFEGLERRAEKGMTDGELFKDISYVLAKIRCGHTKAEYPASIKSYRMKNPSFLPLTVRIFAGRAYVDKIDSEQESQLKRGDELVTINGKPMGDVIEQVERYLSVDGWTDHTKRVELEQSSELMASGLDHFWPLLYGWPEEWVFEVRDAEGKSKTVRLKPIKFDRWQTMALEGASVYADFGSDTVVYRQLEGNVGYLSIDTFVNYRKPLNAVKFLKPFFARMNESKIEHLILDLRGCGGGSDDVPAALARLLAVETIKLTRQPPRVRTYRFDDLREHLTTWENSIWNLPEQLFTDVGDGFFEFRAPGFKETGLIEPMEDSFQGRVTILCSAANSSGATNFTALMKKKRKKVRVLGEPTGGTVEGTTAGLIFFLKLPNSKIKIRLPALRNYNNLGDFEPGMGVQPDIVVKQTLYNWLLGRDAVLEAAK